MHHIGILYDQGRKCVLSTCNDNELLLNYLFIFVLFVFKDLVNSIGSGFVMIMLVSSAKSTGFAEVVLDLKCQTLEPLCLMEVAVVC